MAKGRAYGVGVGPGDPELITLKALRIMGICDVIAVPGRVPNESLAYRIAASAYPQLGEKEVIALPSPMVRERASIEEAHAVNARVVEHFLDEGRSVAFLTLGDPTLYCTFGYLKKALEADGYACEIVSGVPSFCASAARLGIQLVEGNERLFVLPAGDGVAKEDVREPGTYVFMKAGRRMQELKELLGAEGLSASAVERCGMEGEGVYETLEEMPTDAGYFTVAIAKRRS